MKRSIVILWGLIFYNLSVAQNILSDYLLDKQFCGVDIITEKWYDNVKNEYFYSNEGFLIKKIVRKMRPITIQNITYNKISDTLKVSHKELENNMTSFSSHWEYYYFLDNEQYKGFELYIASVSSQLPSIVGRNFIYRDSLLISFEWVNNEQITTYEFDYNDQNKLIAKRIIDNESSCLNYTYLYNENGLLTDEIFIGNKNDTFVGSPLWNDFIFNKLQIRFSNFDKYGNWQKSWFITEKRTILRSKRRISYYKI